MVSEQIPPIRFGVSQLYEGSPYENTFAGGGGFFSAHMQFTGDLAGLAMMPGRTMTLEQGRQ